MTQSLNAWLLTLNPTTQIAVADSQMTEYLLNTPVAHIPLTPDHCHHVTFWRNQIIPLISIPETDSTSTANTTANTIPNTAPATLPGVQIVHYLKHPSNPEPQFIALQLHTPPQRITLENNQITPPELEQQTTWPNGLISSFKYQNKPISIVDFGALKYVA